MQGYLVECALRRPRCSDRCAGPTQGVTLVLETCCQLQHQPSEDLLEALAAAMRMTLLAFKRQELASCLDAFKALAYHPGDELIQVSWHGCTCVLPPRPNQDICLRLLPVHSSEVCMVFW